MERFYKDENDLYPVQPISPDDGYHYFFGYYDQYAYHREGRYHLAHRVGFMDRLPEPADVCTLGRIDLTAGCFEPFAETTAWNFQQGALLTYNCANYDEVFYNVRQGKDYATCIHNLKTGQKRYTDRACTCYSPDGNYGLAVNFARIFDFRPGYGYAGPKDPWYSVPAAEDDGVFLVDLHTGKSKLILSTAEILRRFPNELLAGEKFVINHITFDPTSRKYLFLLRNFVTQPGKPWLTSLFVADLEGNLTNPLPNTMISHYCWKDAEHILLYCRINGQDGLYLIDTAGNVCHHYSEPELQWDIHCIYSPDQRYFVGDGYPMDGVHRNMYLYDLQENTCRRLVSDVTVQPSVTDIRCDLHNRWDTAGRFISFDSTRNGRREILQIELK